MKRFFLFACVLCLLGEVVAQSETQTATDDSGIDFFIHEEVTNADGESERQIIQLWQDYISSGQFQDPESPYWSFANMKVPDENFWAIDIPSLAKRGYPMQCKVIGVHTVENDHWRLASAFSHVDEAGQVHLDVISAVYAKEVDGRFLLISSAEYFKQVLEHHRVGSINYYVYPFHDFQLAEAEQMQEFNLEMAELFDVEPLEFDYFVASNARHIVDVWGYEYMNRMYNPTGKGGIASWRNNTIYSGNNSSYFPHELVHLYTFHLVPQDPHLWVGEGIATFLGGKSDHSLDWHLRQLQTFLAEQPDFDLSDISKLKIDVPNGEHGSDLRYVIGGLLMKRIYEKEGVPGWIEALKYGTSNEDFHRLLEDKLGVDRDGFDAYVKAEMKDYRFEEDK